MMPKVSATCLAQGNEPLRTHNREFSLFLKLRTDAQFGEERKGAVLKCRLIALEMWPFSLVNHHSHKETFN